MATGRRELSSEVRNLIVQCHHEGKNQCELARIFNISRSTIKSVIKKFHQHGTVENRPGRGRKSLFTNRDVNQLSRAAKLNRKTSLQDITNVVNEGKDHRFCKKTISRKLKSMGYKRRVSKKNMVVKESNRKKRVSWCRARRNWTVEENWKKMDLQ